MTLRTTWLLLPLTLILACDDSNKGWPDSSDEDLSETDDDYTNFDDPTDTDDDDNPVDEWGDTDDTDTTPSGDDDGDGFLNAEDCRPNDPYEPVVVDATSGRPSGDGTLDDPLDSIQDGIDEASHCVYVFEGIYQESIDFRGKDLLVWGVDGSDDTIIDARNGGVPAVTFSSGESEDAWLAGFTVQRGDGELEVSESTYDCSSTDTCTDTYEVYCGGGVYIDGADPTLYDLQITRNDLPEAATSSSGNDTTYTYSYGGGICALNSAMSMSDVTLSGNFADQGGALYVDESSYVAVQRTWIAGNEATDGGGVQVDGGVLAMVNVVSSSNEASSTAGGVLVAGGSLTEINVTHGFENGGAIYLSGSSDATVMNSIIYGSDDDGVYVGGASSFDGTYNNVYGNGDDYSGTGDLTGSQGNISSDPKFSGVSDDGNGLNDDWTLRSSSPSIDAGNSSGSYDDADGSRNDQGAFGGPGGDW